MFKKISFKKENYQSKLQTLSFLIKNLLKFTNLPIKFHKMIQKGVRNNINFYMESMNCYLIKNRLMFIMINRSKEKCREVYNKRRRKVHVNGKII